MSDIRRHNASVFQQRFSETSLAVDDFPTPLWAVRSFMQIVMQDYNWNNISIHDPACGRGYMVTALREYSDDVQGSDMYDYDSGYPASRLLGDNVSYLDTTMYAYSKSDWLITNPPFVLGAEFVLKMLNEARLGVAVIVRNAFLESDTRWRALFEHRKPSIIAQPVERVPMIQGRLDAKATTATAYSWLAWNVQEPNTSQFVPFMWIPPCRKLLERAWDYPPLPEVGSM